VVAVHFLHLPTCRAGLNSDGKREKRREEKISPTLIPQREKKEKELSVAQ